MENIVQKSKNTFQFVWPPLVLDCLMMLWYFYLYIAWPHSPLLSILNDSLWDVVRPNVFPFIMFIQSSTELFYSHFDHVTHGRRYDYYCMWPYACYRCTLNYRGIVLNPSWNGIYEVLRDDIQYSMGDLLKRFPLPMTVKLTNLEKHSKVHACVRPIGESEGFFLHSVLIPRGTSD